MPALCKGRAFCTHWPYQMNWVFLQFCFLWSCTSASAFHGGPWLEKGFAMQLQFSPVWRGTVMDCSHWLPRRSLWHSWAGSEQPLSLWFTGFLFLRTLQSRMQNMGYPCQSANEVVDFSHKYFKGDCKCPGPLEIYIWQSRGSRNLSIKWDPGRAHVTFYLRVTCVCVFSVCCFLSIGYCAMIPALATDNTA